MSRIHVLGIDPGFKGALAALNMATGRLDGLIDMPVEGLKTGKSRIKFYELAAFLKVFAATAEIALVEEVASMPRDGVVSAFQFGYNAGTIAGALGALDIPILFVKPTVWKAQMGLNYDKKQSLARAIREFPRDEVHFSLNKHDGRAESALLALFATKKLMHQRP